MIKVAVLDDYQNVFRQIVEMEHYKDKFEFQIFNEPFFNEQLSVTFMGVPALRMHDDTLEQTLVHMPRMN